MAKNIFLIALVLLLSNCGVIKKRTTYSNERKVTVAPTKTVHKNNTKKTVSSEFRPSNSIADYVISSAMEYSGVRYKYGGTSKKGIDCSGLLYLAFGENNVQLPRVSYQMAEEGHSVKLKNVSKGDLLFFKTSRRSKKINHVGMVVAIEGDEIKFIHASSSRGVIVSSLREGYWNAAFVKATRVL